MHARVEEELGSVVNGNQEIVQRSRFSEDRTPEQLRSLFLRWTFGCLGTTLG